MCPDFSCQKTPYDSLRKAVTTKRLHVSERHRLCRHAILSLAPQEEPGAPTEFSASVAKYPMNLQWHHCVDRNLQGVRVHVPIRRNAQKLPHRSSAHPSRVRQQQEHLHARCASLHSRRTAACRNNTQLPRRTLPESSHTVPTRIAQTISCDTYRHHRWCDSEDTSREVPCEGHYCGLQVCSRRETCAAEASHPELEMPESFPCPRQRSAGRHSSQMVCLVARLGDESKPTPPTPRGSTPCACHCSEWSAKCRLACGPPT